MTTTAHQLQATLGQQPNVLGAEVIYQNTLDAPGTAAVNIRLKPGVDLQPVFDDAVRTVWQSKLNPLYSIDVDIAYDNSDQPGITKTINAVQQKSELESRYGPHPAR